MKHIAVAAFVLGIGYGGAFAGENCGMLTLASEEAVVTTTVQTPTVTAQSRRDGGSSCTGCAIEEPVTTPLQALPAQPEPVVILADGGSSCSNCK